MADVAAIFHWTRADFDPLTLEELMDERHLAIDRGIKLGLLGNKE